MQRFCNAGAGIDFRQGIATPVFLVMVDHVTPERRSFIMSKVGQKNTALFSVLIHPTLGEALVS
ncbi:very short patch repair endonuclease [Aliiroseovarius sp. M344]|uniref:very short patch repair endonuclease n=1 Tax=Aliiroseovarius sp. M344 TaxID=2867010 RepID=UPI0021ADAB83|nr:very short patch repair endonuclease [Aliiroseovarius sp. M344]UWQ15686.1 very short patch repair endonuclease [Aliiroseovarius sp. M344]